jgi:hypothetical protein
MLNFAKVSAASEGALIRAYMTQDKPEPETLKVHGVAIDGRTRNRRAPDSLLYRPRRAGELAAGYVAARRGRSGAKVRADRDDELDAP